MGGSLDLVPYGLGFSPLHYNTSKGFCQGFYFNSFNLALRGGYGIMLQMKYALSFLLGMVTCYYIAPPTPTVKVDALTKQQIAYEVVELLEANHFDTLETLRLIAEPKKSWFSL